MTSYDYFNNRSQEEDQSYNNTSANDSDAIESNNVKINVCSEKNHSLIYNDTMQATDVSVIPSKENVKCQAQLITQI